jgi:hypothetical protein
MERVRLTVIATGFAVLRPGEEEEGSSLGNETMLAKMQNERLRGSDDLDIPTYLRRSRKARDENTRPWGTNNE